VACTEHVPGTESIVLLVDHQLRRAIAEKRLIAFTYQSTPRVAEPHDYGVLKGRVRLLVFQIRSTPFSRGWRLLDVVDMQQLDVLDQTFAGSRGDRHRHHYHWDTLFARVE
jgi:hypothetical protein